MNDTTRHHVIDRIESLAASASADVQVPPFDIDRHRNVQPSPRRSSSRRRLVAAVVTVLLAASGTAWALYGDDGAQSVRTAASDSSEEIDAMVPAQWPAGIDGEVVAHVDLATLGPLEMDHRVATAVLELDGDAAAAVITEETSLRAMSATPPRAPAPDDVAGVLDGRPTLWRDRPDGTLIGFIEVAENRTVMISSRTVERAELERLASGIAEGGGDPSTATPPEGWTAAASDATLSDLFVFGQPDGEWSTVSGGSRDRSKHVGVSTTRSTDADADLERVREFAGSTARRVDVTAEGDGVLVPFSSNVGGAMHAVVWVPSPGLLAVAVGGGVEADEVVATARSAERATRAQWDALLPEVDRVPMQTVDGVDIPTTATAVASGESSGLRWMVIVDRPVIPDESKEDLDPVNLGLVLIDSDGRRGSTGWGDPAQLTSINGQIGTYFVIGAVLPSGTTDVAIERNGELLAYDHFALPDGEHDLYLTIVPAKDVDPDLSAVMTATLPDGTPFVAVR